MFTETFLCSYSLFLNRAVTLAVEAGISRRGSPRLWGEPESRAQRGQAAVQSGLRSWVLLAGEDFVIPQVVCRGQ